MTTRPDLTAAREWNACVEVRVIATTAPRPADMQSGEDDDYCTASTRRDGVWNDRGVQDPPLCCWRPPDHEGDHHDPYEHLDWRWEARYDWMGRAEAALAARSAGSGSRVEAKWPVVGVGDKGHRYTTCGHCVEPDCSTHTGHIERCYTRPTPPPAVDGTRCGECGGVKDDVFHVPCLVGGPFHYVKTCHPFTPPTPAPAVDGLAAFAAGFRARHEWPAPAPADRLRALEAALRDWVEEVGLHDACDPDEFCSLLGDLRKKEPAARALLGSDGEGSRS